MLSKLLKYELKSTARWFLPLYIALIILTFLNKLTITINLPDFILFNILKVLLMVFYVLIIIFTSIATMILLVVRFYKNLYTDEGYLTHTLPVKPGTHLNCKILSGCIWTQVFLCRLFHFQFYLWVKDYFQTLQMFLPK